MSVLDKYNMSFVYQWPTRVARCEDPVLCYPTSWLFVPDSLGLLQNSIPLQAAGGVKASNQLHMHALQLICSPVAVQRCC
jgi:hypothetical protein